MQELLLKAESFLQEVHLLPPQWALMRFFLEKLPQEILKKQKSLH